MGLEDDILDKMEDRHLSMLIQIRNALWQIRTLLMWILMANVLIIAFIAFHLS